MKTTIQAAETAMATWLAELSTEQSPCSLFGTLSALVPPGAKLCTEVPTHLFVLSAPGALALVFYHLLAHARQRAGNAAVLVRARTAAASSILWPAGTHVSLKGQVVLLTVMDEGTEKTDGQRLFAPADSSGIALWLCRQVVRSHGGDLWLEQLARSSCVTAVWPGASPLQPGAWPRERVALGRAVRQARDAVHLSRAELARRSGLSEATIRNVELGRHKSTANVLLSITQVLDKCPAGLRLWPRAIVNP